jgi:hypothetical protein
MIRLSVGSVQLNGRTTFYAFRLIAENQMLHASQTQSAGMTRKNHLQNRWGEHQGPSRFPEHPCQATSKLSAPFDLNQAAARLTLRPKQGPLRQHVLFHILP